MRVFRWLAVLAAAGLSACSTDQALRPEHIRPLHYSTGIAAGRPVEGLRAALQASRDRPVQVLALHGMIQHDAGYSAELQLALAQRLGLRRASDSGPVPVHRGYRFTPVYGAQPFDGVAGPLPGSTLRRTAWVDAGAPAGAPERLVFHELLWAPLRDRVKQRFIACFESAALRDSPDCAAFSASRPNTDPRALLNRLLKDQFTLGGFADATLVLGPIGDVLRDDVTLALCLLAVDILRPLPGMVPTAPGSRCELAAVAPTPALQQHAALALADAKVFGITHSLGSFLMLDAQHRFAQVRAEPGAVGRSESEVVQETLLFWLFDDATVFMNANQVALLSLARLSPAACQADSGSGPCPNRLVRRPDPWDGPMPLAQMSTYVAFNDTDDLLGFELPPFLADTDGNRYVNVSVRNPGWRLPGLLKDPAAAHTAQARNPAIVRAIAEGFGLPAR